MWPAHSPDLNPYDFYLWGTPKIKEHVDSPHSLWELKDSI